MTAAPIKAAIPATTSQGRLARSSRSTSLAGHTGRSSAGPWYRLDKREEVSRNRLRRRTGRDRAAVVSDQNDCRSDQGGDTGDHDMPVRPDRAEHHALHVRRE
jgi:hypothetical protein